MHNSQQGSLLLSEYASAIAETDVLIDSEVRVVLHGLFGEVGDIMSTAKKCARDGNTPAAYRAIAEEEFGDTLWYLAAICRRSGFELEAIFSRALTQIPSSTALIASDTTAGPIGSISIPRLTQGLDESLRNLAAAAANLLQDDTPNAADLAAFARHYLGALHATGIPFAQVLNSNLRKARGAFVEPSPQDLVDFDHDYDIEERLPAEFKIRIDQRASGKSYLQWNGVFIGDPLTDNIADPDGYRFHDVFHLANAAILHWSPVTRALLKQKRKSNHRTDEEQDGGRAIVVEEGLTAWLFCRAKQLDYFSGHTRIPLGMLKILQQFVAGYEVEQCPLKLWERAILQGYDVFRKVKHACGGWVIGNRFERTLTFCPLEPRK